MQVPVNYLISRSMSLLGVKAEGQTLGGSIANDACYVLNEVLDGWNADGDMIYSVTNIVLPLANAITASDGTTYYTIGPDLTNGVSPPSIIVPQRPAFLAAAQFRSALFPQVTDIPMKVATGEEYASIRTKGLATPISYIIYMDEQYPVANIYLYPEASQGASLYLTYWNYLPTNLTQSSVLNLPPGYTRAVRYDLACSMAREFGLPVPPDIASTLANLKRDLKYNNKRSNQLIYSREASGVRTGSGTYDSNSDEVL